MSDQSKESLNSEKMETALATPANVAAREFDWRFLKEWMRDETVVLKNGLQGLLLINGGAIAHSIPHGSYQISPEAKQGILGQTIEAVAGFFGCLFGRTSPSKDGTLKLGSINLAPKNVKEFSLIVGRINAFSVPLIVTASKGADPLCLETEFKITDLKKFHGVFLLDDDDHSVTFEEIGEKIGRRIFGDDIYEQLKKEDILAEKEKILAKEWAAAGKETGLEFVRLARATTGLEKGGAQTRLETEKAKAATLLQEALLSARNQLLEKQAIGEETREKLERGIRERKFLGEHEERRFLAALKKKEMIDLKMIEAAIGELETSIRHENERKEWIHAHARETAAQNFLHTQEKQKGAHDLEMARLEGKKRLEEIEADKAEILVLGKAQTEILKARNEVEADRKKMEAELNRTLMETLRTFKDPKEMLVALQVMGPKMDPEIAGMFGGILRPDEHITLDVLKKEILDATSREREWFEKILKQVTEVATGVGVKTIKDMDTATRRVATQAKITTSVLRGGKVQDPSDETTEPSARKKFEIGTEEENA